MLGTVFQHRENQMARAVYYSRGDFFVRRWISQNCIGKYCNFKKLYRRGKGTQKC